MRTDWSALEPFRVKRGVHATNKGSLFGAFLIPAGRGNLRILASSGEDWQDCGLPLPVWEHVSVSLEHRTPTWGEMSFVKDLFWEEQELVLQFHVPKTDHINAHTFCLHLWKPVGIDIPLPPKETLI